jgi:hypothetical protein
MRRRGLILLVLPLALAGCSTVSNNGTSSAPTGPLSAACQQTRQAVTSVENNAGKLSNTEWNNPVGDLSGQWNSLRLELISAGVASSQKVSSAYSDLASDWGKC